MRKTPRAAPSPRWGFGGEDEVGTSRVAAFKAAAPGVKVTINKGDFDAQQFLTAVSSGPMIIIFAFTQRYVLDGIATSAKQG